MLDHHWKHIRKPEFGLMNHLSELVQALDLSTLDRIPNMQRGSQILIGSDFSGDNPTSDYEVLSVILADIEHSGRWGEQRSRIRATMPNDGRRFAFKNLRDKTLARVLPDFLECADTIPGLLVSFLTHKSIPSLFKATGRITANDPQLINFPRWKPRVMERLLRTVHFISLFLAGVSRPGQNVLWITDEDAIAANEEKHRQLVTIFGQICCHYLQHSLGHLRIATTASDTGKRDVEDFVAIPDLAAGALAEVITLYGRDKLLTVKGLTVPSPTATSSKVQTIVGWLSGGGKRLKKLCFAIDPVPKSTELSLKVVSFSGGAF